jgi:UDP-N-acetyl-D-glucosamine dehydrogenase
MPHFVVDKVQNALNDATKPLKSSHVHVMGVAYKRDIDDMRESPALDIIHLLKARGAHVTYTDPWVPTMFLDHDANPAAPKMHSTDEWAEADCVVIVTDHRSFDYKKLVEESKIVVDTRNACKGMVSDKIVRL